MNIRLSEVIKNQAIINVGSTGHVANGKSTIVHQMTGVQTQKFARELERNITINIGYANCKIFHSPKLKIYKAVSSNTKTLNDINGDKMLLVNHISFVDCPGHEAFMNNMMNGSGVMDRAILVMASNANCFPQSQTREHLIALQNTNITDLLVIQNKCDLVKKDNLEHIKFKIEEFLEDFYETIPPIIPIIAQTGINIDLISNYLANSINLYSKNLNNKIRANIIRTFDINKPNTKIAKLNGGVLGGSIIEGVLKIGDYIQILPGRVIKIDNKWIVKPLYSTVTSIYSDKNKMEYAIPGGLIGIGTKLDPSLCKSDNLIGQIITYPDDNIPIASIINVKYTTIKRDGEKIKLHTKQQIKIGLGSIIVRGIIKDKNSKDKLIKIELESPLCMHNNNVTIIVKNDSKNYKIAGIGEIIDYKIVDKVLYRNDIRNKKIKYNVVNDLIGNYDFNYTYSDMLDKLDYTKISKKKYDIPNPIISKSKKKGIIYLQNFNNIVEKSIHEKDKIEFRHIFIRYLDKLIGSKTSITNNGFLKFETNYDKSVLKNNIIKLLKNLKKCKTCGSSDTYLTKDKRTVKVNCISCNSVVNLKT